MYNLCCHIQNYKCLKKKKYTILKFRSLNVMHSILSVNAVKLVIYSIEIY